MGTLRDDFGKGFKVKFTSRTVKTISKFKTMIELRDDMPEVLNTPMLGIKKGYFYPSDQEYLFEIFDMRYGEFEKMCKAHDSINSQWNVSSDPYNLFTVWLVYLAEKSSLSVREKFEVKTDLLCLLQYKFFTSLTNQFFKHNVNPDIMEYTINTLSKKYDIVNEETNTWKLLIAKRSEYYVSNDSIHFNTIKTFLPDDKVIYIIIDIQNRLRDTIKNIAREFYDNVEQDKALRKYSILAETDEGVEFKSVENRLHSSYVVVNSTILTVDKLINPELINLTCDFVGTIQQDTFRVILTKFSELATRQYHDGTSRKTRKLSNDMVKLEGISVFVEWVIQKTYRRAIHNDIDIKDHLLILKHARNIYTNSRVNDPEILSIKSSALGLVDKTTDLKKEQHKSSARLALIIYILLLSMTL